MGMNDAKQNKKDDLRRAAQENRKRRSNKSVNGGVADWGSVNGEILGKAVAAIAQLGGALRLGYTRDGGAYAIGIYGDGEPFTEYVPPSEDIESYLGGIIDDYSR